MGLRDIVLLAIIAGLVPLALARPWTGILSWAWIGYMNPHKLAWALQTYPVAEAIALATLVGLLITRDRKPIPWTREMIVLFLLAAWFTVTTLFAWNPDGAWLQWEKVMKILLFTAITPMLIYGHKRIRWLLLLTALSIGFYGFKGGVFSLVTGGHYKIYGPASSFIADNNSIGLAMAMVLPMLLISARGESRRYLRGFLYATFGLTIIAIIFTYSRGALLGLASVLLALFWRYKGRILIIALVAGLGFFFVKDFIPEQWFARQETTLHFEHDYSAMQRIQAWSVAKNVALANPLVGAG
ncbi:MAG: putative O-glycosylation ligase, exosortase A system-associated, partial [Gammaproteobacteria bacterium]